MPNMADMPKLHAGAPLAGLDVRSPRAPQASLGPRAMSASAHLTTTVDRVFVKRTRRGQVKTHVRQTYLRDDLPSGSPHIDGPELEPRLSASATRYLVLDTNVVLHQIDLLERPTLCDVIVTQTVLDEVRHNKISVHKRLRALIADEKRRFLARVRVRVRVRVEVGAGVRVRPKP